MKNNLSALYLALKRKDTPFAAKIIVVLAVGYALSPIDLIPDFIPVLGLLDDILLLPFLVILATKLIPKPIMDECREQAKGLWESGMPRNFWYSIPIIAIWLLIIVAVLKAIL